MIEYDSRRNTSLDRSLTAWSSNRHPKSIFTDIRTRKFDSYETQKLQTLSYVTPLYHPLVSTISGHIITEALIFTILTFLLFLIFRCIAGEQFFDFSSNSACRFVVRRSTEHTIRSEYLEGGVGEVDIKDEIEERRRIQSYSIRLQATR